MSSAYNITDLKDLKEYNALWIKKLSDRSVIWLQGPVGVGKTEWVRTSLKQMGYQLPVASPSFATHHTYFVQNQKVTHIDLYRIQTEDEFESIGFLDLFKEEKGIIFVEWADRLEIQMNGWNQFFLNFYWKNHCRMLEIKQQDQNNVSM